MFTGIIDHSAIIGKIENTLMGKRFWIQHRFSDISLGESIAVNGICLTVSDISGDSFACDLSPETLKVTNAQFLQMGDEVNLERALLFSSRLGGHFMTGHVDQVLRLKKRETLEDFVVLDFEGFGSDQRKWLVQKGSIAVNGVSLTINTLHSEGFSVTLIPHTLAITNLKHLKPQDVVNIEFDMMAKMINERCEIYLAARGGN